MVFIYQEFLAKKKQGLNVRIIVSQEDSNTNMISKLKENKLDLVVIPRWEVEDITVCMISFLL